MVLISPSMLSCDFSMLRAEAQRMDAAGADLLHLDVMDGHFVPNLTFGAPVLKALRQHTKTRFDVHLMISDPLAYIADFVDAGADILTFHLESDSDPERTIQSIRACGCRVGMAIKPATPADALLPYLDKLDMALVMTVEPGFGGQSFMADMLPKIRRIRQVADERGLTLDIQADGGISDQNAPRLRAAGANVLVAGSYIFGAADPKRAIDSLR